MFRNIMIGTALVVLTSVVGAEPLRSNMSLSSETTHLTARESIGPLLNETTRFAERKSIVPKLTVDVPGDADGSSDSKLCTVTVDRSGDAGSYDVQRQDLENGDCICLVYTGPEPQSASIERRIEDLQSRRECSDAPLLAASAQPTVGKSNSFFGLPLLGLLSAAGAGAAVASSGGENVSPQ